MRRSFRATTARLNKEIWRKPRIKLSPHEVSMKSLVSKMILFSLCSAATAWAGAPCGLSGSIESRIANCNESRGVDGEFQLVTRTRGGAEVYMGYRTGVIWSADLPGPMNYLRDGAEDICDGNHPEFGGLTNLEWKLPEVGRYIQALDYDIQSALPETASRAYWTSTPDRFYVTSRYIFEGDVDYREDSNGRFTFRHLEADLGLAHVKCIAETL